MVAENPRLDRCRGMWRADSHCRGGGRRASRRIRACGREESEGQRLRDETENV